jgi:P-type conjugative transfer protein TrbJ
MERCSRVNSLRRRLLTLAVSAALLAFGATPAGAQFPVTDVAHIAVNSYWHYAHYVQFAYQIYQQYLQLANQYAQIRYQLQALRKLADPNWRNLAGLLAELEAVVRSGRALGYTLANAEAEFRVTFPGWRTWSGPEAYQLQTERALDTMRAGLGAVARQGQSLAAGEETLAAIRGQMAGNVGHQQALEQLATLAGFQAQEGLLARQSLAVSANLQAVANAYWLNREAQSQATFALVTTETALAGERNGSPGWTFLPKWWPFY